MLSGDDSPAVRHQARRPAQQQRRQGRQRRSSPSTPTRRRAAFDGLTALARRRAGLRGRASSRAPARSWRWSSLPTYDPNKLASPRLRRGRRGLRPARRRPGRAAAQPRHPDHAAAGLDVQAGHRGGGDRERQLRRRARWCPAARRTSCRRPRARPARSTTRAATAAPSRIPFTQAMENSCNTTFAQLADELGADAMREQAEAFGFNSHLPRRPRPAGRVACFPRTMNAAADRAVRHRPVRGARPRRCRWRWSAPASPTAAS